MSLNKVTINIFEKVVLKFKNLTNPILLPSEITGTNAINNYLESSNFEYD